MLFWHVALLFSVLCTSVLASPGEPHESAPIQYVGASKSVKRLQGLWVRLPPKGDPKVSKPYPFYLTLHKSHTNGVKRSHLWRHT